MGLFDRIKSEVRSAGNAARGAIDEGRLRIDIFRVRQRADAAAQALGYAVHRARRDGRELDASTMERLDGVLAEREAEAGRLEAELARQRGDVKADDATRHDDGARTPPSGKADAAPAGDPSAGERPAD